MINVYVKEIDGRWFGLAYIGEQIVATTVSTSKEIAIRNLTRSIPSDAEHQIVERGSEYTEKMVHMLKALESGNEESKSFSLATEYVPDVSVKVLRAAAAVPIGYVASYGGIAKAADVEAKVVGRMMATNPLYPIVPCHRVVGADFSLVGYGGGKSQRALQAKLARLCKEAKGFTKEKEIVVNGEKLTVYPVENVIKKAKKRGLDVGQKRLFEN